MSRMRAIDAAVHAVEHEGGTAAVGEKRANFEIGHRPVAR